MRRKKVLAICGSTRKDSSNLRLIKAIAGFSKEYFDVVLWVDLVKIPQFNPDEDNEQVPLEVIEFRRQMNLANGVLICTPEYAMGIPGALKNAIDWTVSSGEFSKKPVAAITA
ncbi:MAG: NAD(P)H-dependent oxidoreductase, partial [Cytophagales bacterium]|nr:NAD(P)H-dependent oxidoreductase [Cytophagales bacterium]